MEGVVTGGRHHAQHLPRFVIIHRHRARVAVQRLVGLVIITGVDGQIQLRSGRCAIGAVEEVVPRQIPGKGIEGAGADPALEISHRVEGGLADRGVVVIRALAVLRPGQHVPIRSSTVPVTS